MFWKWIYAARLDDVLVLMHNNNVMETTGVDKRIKEFESTSREFQELDAAHWWRQAGKVFPSGAELGVPRLEYVSKSSAACA